MASPKTSTLPNILISICISLYSIKSIYTLREREREKAQGQNMNHVHKNTSDCMIEIVYCSVLPFSCCHLVKTQRTNIQLLGTLAITIQNVMAIAKQNSIGNGEMAMIGFDFTRTQASEKSRFISDPPAANWQVASKGWASCAQICWLWMKMSLQSAYMTCIAKTPSS